MNTYDDALQRLEVIYDKETAHFSLQCFISAKQDTGEDGLNYLLRIDQYSRCAYHDPHTAYAPIPGATDAINAYARKLLVNRREDDRSRPAIVVAVNGLADQCLRLNLMARGNLTRDDLCNHIRVAETIRSDMNCLIQGNIDLPTNEVKAEINTVNACRPRTHRPDRYDHERQTRSCREKRRDNRYWACWA